MSKNKNNRNRSPKERAAIRRYYAIHTKKEVGRVEAPYPHFRYYKKSKHPALIVGEQKTRQKDEEYKYRKVMHNRKDGDRTNEVIYPNPDPKDPDPMCIGKRVRHDLKENFEPKPLLWKYPKKDK